MRINMAELFMHQSEPIGIERELEKKVLSIGETKYRMATPIYIKLVLSQLETYFYKLQGHVEVELIMSCDRCMEEVNEVLSVEIDKDFNVETDQVDQDFYDYLEGNLLDLEKMVLDEIYVNLPMKVLCKESCLGLCSSCGINLNQSACTCENEPIDLRWAGLKDLFEK